MAVINFPDSPSDGATQTVGGITYTYSSSKGYWTAAASSGGGGGGGSSVTTDDSAPSSPSDGDLWYDTDDGGMFVYYADTDSSQWVEVIGSQGATGAAGAAGADGGAGVASVYATVNDLPVSGNTQGDMAHVTANNTLYFWNGSGWYKIALINTNPSISGVSSSYALADDGTATTVTVTASDPEGLPITYSIASDTSGNIATVSQGTGASTNVFTITPSTNSAYAGSFTLTFRASDGVNIATAPATFTLQFIVQNSNYTTALITTSSSAGTNSTFADSSTNSLTVTANGNVHQTSFSPNRSGGYSAYFDGTGDYITTTLNSNFSSKSYTIEGWFYPSINLTGRYSLFNVGSGTSSTDRITIGVYDGTFFHQHEVGNSNTITVLSGGIGNYTLTAGQWHHFEMVFDWGGAYDSTSTGYIFMNGVLQETYRLSGHVATSIVELSRSDIAGGAKYFPGYISDFRVRQGTAAHTTNFTPPDERLTAITNTSLLTCHLPYLADGSTNGHTLTLVGNVVTQPFGPYDYKEYAVGEHGGSAYFDGTGDYLSIPAGDWKTFGTDDFTMEMWFNTSDTGSQYLFADINSGGSNNTSTVMILLNAGVPACYIQDTTYNLINGSTSIRPNQWHHIAVVRNGATITLYLDGKSETTYNIGTTAMNTSTEPGSLGRMAWSSSYDYTGYISDFRVVKGTALYTANFTPPVGALTAVTNTSLLVGMQGAKILDKSQSTKNIALFGDTTSSTAQYKYLPTSMYFDGTGDYITTTLNNNFSSKSYTIEGWFYPSINLTGRYSLFNIGSGTSSTDRITIGVYDGAFFHQHEVGNTNRITVLSGGIGNYTLTSGQWHHFEMVFDWGGAYDATSTGYIFMNGVLQETYRLSAHVATSIVELSRSDIGGGAKYFPGYISDFRVRQGIAAHTANFTPPTAALQG